MNRPILIARKIAAFLLDKDVDTGTLSMSDYAALNPPVRGPAVKKYFMNWRRGMLIIGKELQALKTEAAAVKPTKPVKPVVAKST